MVRKATGFGLGIEVSQKLWKMNIAVIQAVYMEIFLTCKILALNFKSEEVKLNQYLSIFLYLEINFIEIKNMPSNTSDLLQLSIPGVTLV